MSPKVSVVVPVYNVATFLLACLDLRSDTKGY